MKIVPQSKSLTTWPHDSAVNRQEIPQQQKKAIKNLQGRSSKPAKACARISILHTEKSGLTHKAKMRAQFRLLHLQIATRQCERCCLPEVSCGRKEEASCTLHHRVIFSQAPDFTLICFVPMGFTVGS